MPADLKSHGHHPRKKALPGFVWLLSGLAIGLFVAFLVYLDKQPATEVSFGDAVRTELEKIKREPAETGGESVADKVADKPGKADREPRFNFYTILPELEVLIPEDEIRPPDSDTASGDHKTRDTSVREGKKYILQAGSFRNRKDAERLKASIALLGMEASIKRVTIDRTNWHRVRIGPVSNSRDLYENLNLLHRNEIDAIAMELKQD